MPQSNSQQKKPSYNGRTGYALHTARLSYVGKEGMRSAKIPLDGEDSTRNTLWDNVRADYIGQVGEMNIGDWYEGEQKGAHVYALADFWLDSLRAGVIFSHKEKEMHGVIAHLNGDETFSKKFSLALAERNPELAALADNTALYQFFISGKRPGKKTDEEFFWSVRNSVFPRFRNVEDATVDAYARRLVDTVLKQTKDDTEADTLKIVLAKEYVGFDPTPDIPYKHTCFFHPQTSLLPDASAKQILAMYKELATQKDPTLYGYDGENESDVMKQIFGLFNNQGAFANYFNTTLADFRAGGEHTEQAIVTVSPYWATHRNELHARIMFLVERARMLPEPHLTKGWHDYRSTFGGKIESWVSNVLRQEKEIAKQLFGGIEESGKGARKKETFVRGHKQILEEVLADTCLSDDTKAIAHECFDLVLRMEISGITDADLLLYRTMLGDARIGMNVDYQTAYPELKGKTEKERKQEEKEKRAYRKYATLYTNIKLIPNFLGDSKRIVYKKFIQSAEILHTSIATLASLEMTLSEAPISPKFTSDDEAEIFVTKLYETLRKKYAVLNATRFRGVIEGIFRHLKGTLNGEMFDMMNVLERADETESTQKIEYVCYTPPYARVHPRRRTVDIIIKNEDIPALLDTLLVALKPRWDDIMAGGDIGELADAVEMEKIRMGIVVALWYRHPVARILDELSEELFSSAHAFAKLKGNPETFSGEDLGRLLQSGILSEMKGAITTMSRVEYTERYTGQLMNTETHMPLCRTEDGWHILSGKYQKKEKDGMIAVPIKKGKGFEGETDYTTEYIHTQDLLHLNTSVYQLQFLDKTLPQGKRTISWWDAHDIAFSLNSYSFIAERNMRIDWDISQKKFRITPGEEKRLFVSIPFSFSPKNKATDTLEKRTRYMGIDVGEYGLAWTIIETDAVHKKVVRILKQGFIYEPLTHTVRTYVATLKNLQTKGTFGMPNTKLERLRENAVGSLRNKVHDIAMRYDAIPVYEFEISNFETGSKRTTVIYNSVKRADVGRGGSEADKAEASLVWGKTGKNFGKEIGAYATSYICSRCGYSPYEASVIEGTRATLDMEKKLSRPSLNDFLKDHSAYKTREEFAMRGNKESIWKERRGNSAIYVCQHCGHVTDADVQASYWIAVKSFAKSLRSKKEEKDNSPVSFEEMSAIHDISSGTTADNKRITRLRIDI